MVGIILARGLLCKYVVCVTKRGVQCDGQEDVYLEKRIKEMGAWFFTAESTENQVLRIGSDMC